MSTEQGSSFTPLRKQTKKNNLSLKYIDTHESDQLRSRCGIEVNGTNIPPLVQTFEEFGLPNNLFSFLRNEKKFQRPTPIQMQSFSCLKEHRDCICLSSTGTGKTYGYVLPLCYHLYKNKILDDTGQMFRPYCLIVVPTRELMNQVLTVTKELIDILKPKRSVYNQPFPLVETPHRHRYQIAHIPPINFNPWHHTAYSMVSTDQSYHQSPVNGNHRQVNRTEIFYVAGFCGGIPIKEQMLCVSTQTKVIIATPGRLIDLCERGHISLESIQYFVIDECDKLLDLGMEDQLRKLVAMVTVNKNKLLSSLWSATLPDSLERLARSAVVNPVYISTGVKDTVPRNIAQNVIFMHSYLKTSRLLQVLRETPFPPVIIFTSSKQNADEIAHFLQEEQFYVAAVHSSKKQQERNEMLECFRNNEFDVLVATDLISRGLDLPDVTHVINFDTPDNIEDYVHRCGRTGRFGRSGLATTFLTLHCKIANELKDMLEATGCEIPAELYDVKLFGKNVITTDMGDRIA